MTEGSDRPVLGIAHVTVDVAPASDDAPQRAEQAAQSDSTEEHDA